MDMYGMLKGHASGVAIMLPFAVALASCDARRPVRPSPGVSGADAHGDSLPVGALMRLGTVRFRHGGAVRTVAWSPDGTRLASGGMDDRIRIWDMPSGREALRIEGHVSPSGVAAHINALAYSADGTKIVSASVDQTIRMWDSTSGAEIWRSEKGYYDIFGIGLTADAALVAVGKGPNVCILDGRTGQSVREIDAHEREVHCVAFSPDGTRIVSAGDEETVRIWQVETGEKALSLGGHRLWSYAVAWSPDATTIATGDSGGWVRLFDAGTGRRIWSRRASCQADENEILCVRFSTDGSLVASGAEDGLIRIFGTDSGRDVRTIATGAAAPVRGLAFASSGDVLASAGGCVRLWDPRTGEERAESDAHRGLVRAVACAPDGTMVATGSQDGTARLWDLKTGSATLCLRGHTRAVMCVAFHPSGDTVATGSLDGTVRLWRVSDASEQAQLCLGEDGIYSLAFAPGGRHLVVGVGWSPGRLTVWEPDSLSVTAEYEAHATAVFDLDFSSAGGLLASAGSDNVLRVWRYSAAGTLDPVAQYGDLSTGIDSCQINDIQFHPNGELILVGEGAWGGSVRLVRWQNGKVVIACEQKDYAPEAAAISPDGHLIASGAGYDGVIRIWNANTGAQLRTLEGHFGRVDALAFTPDGSRLISGAGDTTVLVWDATKLTREQDTGAASGVR